MSIKENEGQYRISYVFTNLAAMAVLGIRNMKELEKSMIGNTWERTYNGHFRFEDIQPIRDLLVFLAEDEFRRQRIPVYKRYFEDMGHILAEAARKCKPGAQIRLVIAKYQQLYTMKEKKAVHSIDCGAIVSAIGQQVGLIYEGHHDIPLYKSDKVSLYPSNEGVETILAFRTPGVLHA